MPVPQPTVRPLDPDTDAGRQAAAALGRAIAIAMLGIEQRERAAARDARANQRREAA